MNSHDRRKIRREKERGETKLAERAIKIQTEMMPNPTLTSVAHPWRDITPEIDPTKPVMAHRHDEKPRWWHQWFCEWLGWHCQRCIDQNWRTCCRCGGDLWL